MKKTFEKIDSLKDSYIKIWEDVCNIESPTSYKEGVDKVGQYFAGIAKKRGWKVEYFKQNISGDVVCITMNPQSGLNPVTISGHMDTVHPIGSFGTPAVHIDSEKIYGPGVMDCKGGIVAGFMAMDALYSCGFKKRPVRLLLQTDEETSSMQSKKTTVDYICQKAKDSVAFINMEGHSEGEICLQRKGIITFLFTINGIEAHASQCAVMGANAIAEAANKILEIEKFKNHDGITCCCSKIQGGTTANTVPGSCRFKVNVRYATKQQQEQIQNRMREIANSVYIKDCKTELTILTQRSAMELTAKNTELFETVNKIFKKNGLPVLKASKRAGGSDAADVTAFGIPCLDSLGVRGGYIHTLKEYAYMDSLTESAKRIAAIVYDI